MAMNCIDDERREAVRRKQDWTGIDYVEVGDDQVTLYVYFLGKLPEELNKKTTGPSPYLRIEGGVRITCIQVTRIVPVIASSADHDDYLVVTLDKYGDFSTYTLRLAGVAHLDKRYDHIDFSFKINCPSDLDCAATCDCEPPLVSEPAINYLAKDYASFRQLILDRVAVLVPDWRERHVPDLGIALVELLAYTGDYLSYYQDAVATEAYLGTARQRISVRRHARLVDYILHEGCNARAWMFLGTNVDIEIDPAAVSFITGMNNALANQQTVLTWDDLRVMPADGFEIFEPLLAPQVASIRLRAAHNEIHLYTWGEKECCLEKGSTSATLLDSWLDSHDPAAVEGGRRLLDLCPGDVLLFEEIIGPRTGITVDADPLKRCVVRLIAVTPDVDPVILTSGRPTPYVTVEWCEEDHLPFSLCISTIGPAPDCAYLPNVSVARGNMILVDHGETVWDEDLGSVETVATDATCDCAGEPSDIEYVAARFEAKLARGPLTYREELPQGTACENAASTLMQQDPRRALPQVRLMSEPSRGWRPSYDLIECDSDDAKFVVETDNDGVAHLRFGDGELAMRPVAGMSFHARYRFGCGVSGNVGGESISRVVLRNLKIDGVSFTIRNPLPAMGGTDPEPLEEARLYASHVFRKQLERAVIAEDYSTLATRNKRLQGAYGVLDWTGSWYQAEVAIDPLGTDIPVPALISSIAQYLEGFRRIGQDLSVEPAEYVPIDLAMEVCVLPYYERAHVKAALLDAFSSCRLAGGARGFFHPDNLTFGQGIYLSRIIAAAQAVPGVECVRVTRLQRLFSSANGELQKGVLPLSGQEIAQLDNDPVYPERGRLNIKVVGGR